MSSGLDLLLRRLYQLYQHADRSAAVDDFAAAWVKVNELDRVDLV